MVKIVESGKNEKCYFIEKVKFDFSCVLLFQIESRTKKCICLYFAKFCSLSTLCLQSTNKARVVHSELRSRYIGGIEVESSLKYIYYVL